MYRAIGTFSLILAFLFMLLRHMNQFAAAHGGHNLQNFWMPAVFCTLYGLGMVVYKRWAAIPLVLISALPILLLLYQFARPSAHAESILENLYVLTLVSVPELGALFYWWRFKNLGDIRLE